MPILVTKSSMPSYEDYIKEIKQIFDSCWLTNMGPIHKKLEANLKKYLNVPQISLFVNGHLALETALQVLGVCQEGGEVITTPFTFVSTTNAIVRNGLKPVFCDIKADDYTMDPTKIEDLITEKTVAIVPVHVYGNVCDVEAIETIAKKYGLKVIYDAAHAFGVTYKGVGIGNYGDAAMFSFHATKVFHTIEGGCVTFKNNRYMTDFENFKDFGLDGSGDVYAFGGNAKLDEFRAAMGICNLKRIDECIVKRKLAYERYNERLSGVSGLRLNPEQTDVVRNYAYYPVYFDKAAFGKDRDEILTVLKAQDIFARKYFYPTINDMKVYRETYGESSTPIAQDASRHILCLPLFEELGVENVDKICDIILGL